MMTCYGHFGPQKRQFCRAEQSTQDKTSGAKEMSNKIIFVNFLLLLRAFPCLASFPAGTIECHLMNLLTFV